MNDPTLGQQFNLAETLLDRVPVGIAVLDAHLVFQYCNPAWAERIGRHSCAVEGQVVPGTRVADLAPDVQSVVTPFLVRALAGESRRQNGVRVGDNGAPSYWDMAFVPLGGGGQVTGVVSVITDATESVVALQALEQRVADRTRELSALYDVTTAASASLDLQPVMERSLSRVLAVIGCEVGAIHLLDDVEGVLRLAASQGVPPDVIRQVDSVPADRGLAGWTIEQAEPLVVPSIADSPRPLLAVPAAQTQAYVGVPVRARGRVLGVLSVVGEAGRRFDQAEVSLLASIADQVGVVVENTRLYRQAEQLAVIRERQRLARELHDSVAQSLYSLVLLAEAARRLAAVQDLQRVEEAIARLGEIGQQALKEMRLLVYELRPLGLGEEGLIRALQQRLDAVERRAGVDVYLSVEGTVELPETVEVELYRIVQEALNNALKHAAATTVTVQIRAQEEHVEIEVVDNGRGFALDAAEAKGGMGLTGMQERAERLGGSLVVLSSPGNGTRVKVTLERPCQSR